MSVVVVHVDSDEFLNYTTAVVDFELYDDERMEESSMRLQSVVNRILEGADVRQTLFGCGSLNEAKIGLSALATKIKQASRTVDLDGPSPDAVECEGRSRHFSVETDKALNLLWLDGDIQFEDAYEDDGSGWELTDTYVFATLLQCADALPKGRFYTKLSDSDYTEFEDTTLKDGDVYGNLVFDSSLKSKLASSSCVVQFADVNGEYPSLNSDGCYLDFVVSYGSYKFFTITVGDSVYNINKKITRIPCKVNDKIVISIPEKRKWVISPNYFDIIFNGTDFVIYVQKNVDSSAVLDIQYSDEKVYLGGMESSGWVKSYLDSLPVIEYEKH